MTFKPHALFKPYTLNDFVRESNRIEGIRRPPTVNEIFAHVEFGKLDRVTVADLALFVSRVQPKARIRDRVGDDVRVGLHRPPAGGPGIPRALTLIVAGAEQRDAFQTHHDYETLHPFLDGNGRSGRALWLWQMGGILFAPLGFLHHWYYQSLEARR